MKEHKDKETRAKPDERAQRKKLIDKGKDGPKRYNKQDQTVYQKKTKQKMQTQQ